MLHDRGFAYVAEDIVKELLTKNVDFPFRIFSLQESKYPHNDLSGSCCSQFVEVNVYREPDDRFTYSKSLSLFQTPHGPHNRIMLRFLIFIKGASFSNFHKKLLDGKRVVRNQKLEGILRLHTYEISLVLYIFGFWGKRYSMRKNKTGEMSGDIVFIAIQ